MNKDQIIAEIATSLTDKPVPTAAEILVGLRKAFDAGFSQGTIAGSNHIAKSIDLILGGTNRA